MRRTLMLVILALAAAFSFAVGVRSCVWQRNFGSGPPWAGDQRRLDSIAEDCARAAQRARSAP